MGLDYFCFLLVIAIQSSNAVYYPFTRTFRNSNLTFRSNDSLLLEIEDESSVRFFLTSDFGGMFTPPHSTQMQLDSAALMGRLGYELKTHFQFALGDNFYEFGVKGLNDTRFNKSFENIFNHTHLRKTPWFLILGNHDYRGWTEVGDTQAQIDYTFVSKRWIMPSYLYDMDIVLNSKLLVKAVFIDTQLICNEGGANKARYLQQVKDRIKRESQANAPYFIVLGHYPVWSVGTKGTNACMVNRVRPLLKRYNVSGYFCGDEHVMAHYTEESGSSNQQPIEYVISAASSSMFDDIRNRKLVPPGIFKFQWRTNQSQKMNCANCSGAVAVVEVNAKRMSLRFVSTKGENLHSLTIYPRHNSSDPNNNIDSFYVPLAVLILAEWLIVMAFIVFKLKRYL